MSFYAKKVKPHTEPSLVGNEDDNKASERPDTQYKWGDAEDATVTTKGKKNSDPYNVSSC